MARLLVSVRNATEAEEALRGGAGLIDVKEPANGPLGKADDAVIEEVVRVVAGRLPVSAAMGDWWPRAPCRTLSGLAYVKSGLARLGRDDWQYIIGYIAERAERYYQTATVVVAAYADWQAADAPPAEAVCDYVRKRGGVFLIDTYVKDSGQNLLDRIPLRKLALLCKLCRAAGVSTALAGSLGPDEIRRLLPLRPDWIAVRGAACEGGRDSVVSEGKVRELVELLNRSRCGS